jgi:hypothetical protein
MTWIRAGTGPGSRALCLESLGVLVLITGVHCVARLLKYSFVFFSRIRDVIRAKTLVRNTQMSR